MALAIRDANNQSRTLPTFNRKFSAGVSDFTPVAAPTDVFLLKGSDQKRTRLKRVSVSGYCSSGNSGSLIMSLIRRYGDPGEGDSSTLNQRAVFTETRATAEGDWDTERQVAATAHAYTISKANIVVLGQKVGSYIRVGRIFMQAVDAGASEKLVWDFNVKSAGVPALNSQAEWFCINCAGGTVPTGGALDIEMQWVEYDPTVD